MPRPLTLRYLKKVAAVLTMAVASLCGGGKAVAEQKGTLSVVEIEVRETALKRYLDALSVDIRRALREAGNVRRSSPRVDSDSVSVKIKRLEDYDRASSALADLVDPRYFALDWNASSRQFALTATDSLRAIVFDDLNARAIRFFEWRLNALGGGFVISPLPRNRFAIWRASEASAQPISHGPQISTLQVHSLIEEKHTVTKKLSSVEKIPGTQVLRDARDKRATWMIDSTPLLAGSDIYSVTPSAESKLPSIEIHFIKPLAKAGEWTPAHAHKTLALVIDGRVFAARKLDRPLLKGPLSFPSGLSSEDTELLAAQLDSIGTQVKFALLDQCERSKARALRELSC